MKVRFIWPGKIRDEHARALAAEYLKRLGRFVRSEVVETCEFAGSDPGRVARESERLLAAISPGALTLLLDVKGREWSSHELAEQLDRWENQSVKELAVVIGGPDGVSDEVTARADRRWRLSRLTLTHELARVIVLEQVYRAYAINRGLQYQK